MSDKTDVTVNETPENETNTVVVRKFPRINTKTIKVVAVSFTAGAAIAAIVLETMRGNFRDDTAEVESDGFTLTATETTD